MKKIKKKSKTLIKKAIKSHKGEKMGKRNTLAYHKTKLNPQTILARKKLIYQYYKNGYSPGTIQQIFFNSSVEKIKEIIEEMKEIYPLAKVVGDLYKENYKVSSIMKKLNIGRKKFKELMEYYQKNLEGFDK